jgi:hypothetical protein
MRKGFNNFVIGVLLVTLINGCIIVKQSFVIINDSEEVIVPVKISGSEAEDSLNGNEASAKLK